LLAYSGGEDLYLGLPDFETWLLELGCKIASNLLQFSEKPLSVFALIRVSIQSIYFEGIKLQNWKRF
jgi:hypothetical protein